MQKTQQGKVEKPNNAGVQDLITKNQRMRDDLAGRIKTIKNEVDEKDNNEELTEELEKEADQKITSLAAEILVLEKKIQILEALTKQEIQIDAAEEKAAQAAKQYQPTPEEIAYRKDELLQNPDESGWTDATEEMAEGQDEQMWVLDDEDLDKMCGEEDDEESNEEEEEGEKKENIDYDELENQFVTGGESDHHLLFGKHEKFCVSLNGNLSSGIFFSGGGDDYLHFYNLPKEETSPEVCLKPYHLLKHTQTINKIEISSSKEHVFTMTDNQILCTEIKTLETKPLKAKTKEQIQKQGENGQPICDDIVCHTQGDVIAVASGFEIQIFNIKGLKPYQSYYCERAISNIGFTDSGKQLYMACDDYKIRLLTPKTSQFFTISGVKQHKAEISAIKSKDDLIISGCIEGYIGVSNIKKGSMLALIGSKETEETTGSINQLEFAGNYFIAGSTSQCIDWYDIAKTKKLFNNPLQGSPTGIRWQGKRHQHLYSVSTILGHIYFYDCRNPLKEINRTRAGNTIHQLWSEDNYLFTGCEDGGVRVFDVRKFI